MFSKQDLKNANWTNFKTTSIYIEGGVEKKSGKKEKKRKEKIRIGCIRTFFC